MPARDDKPSAFTQSSARRVVRAVRLVERGNRDIHAPPLRTAWDEGQAIKIGKTRSAWSKGTKQEIDIVYEGDCEDEGEPTSLEAWNLSFPVAASVRVKIAQAGNGCWYLVQAESCPSGECCPSIGGQDLKQVSGYDGTKTQILGHESGCLKWFDVYACPEAE